MFTGIGIMNAKMRMAQLKKQNMGQGNDTHDSTSTPLPTHSNPPNLKGRQTIRVVRGGKQTDAMRRASINSTNGFSREDYDHTRNSQQIRRRPFSSTRQEIITTRMQQPQTSDPRYQRFSQQQNPSQRPDVTNSSSNGLDPMPQQSNKSYAPGLNVQVDPMAFHKDLIQKIYEKMNSTLNQYSIKIDQIQSEVNSLKKNPVVTNPVVEKDRVLPFNQISKVVDVSTSQPPKEGVNTSQPPKEGVNTSQPPKEGVIASQPPKEGVSTSHPPKEGVIASHPPKEGVNTSQPLKKEGVIASQPVVNTDIRPVPTDHENFKKFAKETTDDLKSVSENAKRIIQEHSEKVTSDINQLGKKLVEHIESSKSKFIDDLKASATAHFRDTMRELEKKKDEISKTIEITLTQQVVSKLLQQVESKMKEFHNSVELSLAQKADTSQVLEQVESKMKEFHNSVELSLAQKADTSQVLEQIETKMKEFIDSKTTQEKETVETVELNIISEKEP
jgi:hypothetical protein